MSERMYTEAQYHTLIHRLNDVATVSAKQRRVINESMVMLRDALTALRRGKPHVTDDHVERVIAALEWHVQ